METWYKLKIKEFRSETSRQLLEKNYSYQEVKRLRVQRAEVKSRLTKLEERVRL